MMTLAQALRAEGHEVEFATFAGRSLGQHARSLGYRATDYRVRLKIDLLAVAAMARDIRRGRFDIVHTHLSTSTLNGCLAARLAGVPGIATVHGMSGKLSYLPCDHLIAVSGGVRQHLVAQGIHESKISIVPNGIPARAGGLPGRSEIRRALALPEQAHALVTTARLTPLKGVNHSLTAFSRVLSDFPDAVYCILGDGECRGELAQLANNLGVADHVRWLGYRQDVNKILGAFDVFLFPTLREAMGIAVVEAMAAGLPIVASAVGGIPEVVTKETGVLVPPADPVAMADAALALLRDPERRQAMSSAAVERTRTEFSAQRMAARTTSVYSACLAAKE